jgi:ABC-2 type transport system permease protein
MDWSSILGTLLVAIPAYILASALMVAVGALVSTVQEGQSISSLFAVLHIAPLYVGWAFLNDPQSALAGWLSMLPFTSLITIGLRNLSTIVPAWQIAVSVLVQCLCALGATWLASRAFRAGSLRYGQRLKISRLFKPSRAK